MEGEEVDGKACLVSTATGVRLKILGVLENMRAQKPSPAKTFRHGLTMKP
jgi:hypothetical protein